MARQLGFRQAQVVYALGHADPVPLDATQVADVVVAQLGHPCTRAQARAALEQLRWATSASRTREARPMLVRRQWYMGTWRYALTAAGRARVPG